MFIEKTDRKIIPRWRDFLTTVGLGELSSGKSRENGNPAIGADRSLSELKKSWTASGTLWHALDLIGGAFVLGSEEDPEVEEAAAFVVNNASTCPSAGLSLARRILKLDAKIVRVSEAEDVTTDQLRAEIHWRRQRLNSDPRNWLLWIDLARLYTISGHTEKAERAIEVAYRQLPNNRFVLRSAARFYTHIGERSRAISILRRSDAITVDPWLTAAEIGLSLLTGISPKFVKSARQMLENRDHSPFMITELASAVGTLELQDGRQRLAKKFFQRSLDEPTENSLAQAEWAKQSIPSLDVNLATADTPRNYEANALYGYVNGYWDLALENALNWLHDQPFSSRPAGVASYIYSTMFDQHENAEAILKRSLIANPADRLLNNNLAFALISQNKIEEAEKLLGSVDFQITSDTNAITLCATMGLLLFRKQEFAAGVQWYRNSIELCRRQGDPRYEAFASLYLAREAAKAGLPNSAEMLQQARQLAEKRTEADVAFVLSKVIASAGQRKLWESETSR